VATVRTQYLVRPERFVRTVGPAVRAPSRTAIFTTNDGEPTLVSWLDGRAKTPLPAMDDRQAIALFLGVPCGPFDEVDAFVAGYKSHLARCADMSVRHGDPEVVPAEASKATARRTARPTWNGTAQFTGRGPLPAGKAAS
jgi:hypothetical protein